MTRMCREKMTMPCPVCGLVEVPFDLKSAILEALSAAGPAGLTDEQMEQQAFQIVHRRHAAAASSAAKPQP
jgi:hypothetical protein